VSLTSSDIPGSAWRKAQRSVANGACVEVASMPEVIAVRDSKDPSGPVLSYPVEAWAAFIEGAKSGEFDPR